mmetsp:Transcript_22576/g.62826  ORF Transcript_22576/g.62826 Transcript_22576/m.62826 type:complete len:214 (+) Transcript_22576:642-1283(+)
MESNQRGTSTFFSRFVRTRIHLGCGSVLDLHLDLHLHLHLRPNESPVPVQCAALPIGIYLESRTAASRNFCLFSLRAAFVRNRSQQQDLRYGVDWDLADRINNFNRHYSEYAGYWESTSFQSDVDQDMEDGKAVTFYDSGWKGHPLFTAPMDRTWDDFLSESKKHGWPSFRDNEVNWDYARVLPGGEMVSVDGSHLGHNLPDGQGNRYCISKF